MRLAPVPGGHVKDVANANCGQEMWVAHCNKNNLFSANKHIVGTNQRIFPHLTLFIYAER